MRPRHDQSGFALIEVLVSALLVALVAVGTLGAMDAASRSSGRTKSRGVAASIAQQDQDRLRAMPVTTLATLNSSRTVPMCDDNNRGCITYTVASRGELMVDNSAPPSCSTSGAKPYNIHITSTVTSTITGTKPVVEDSLVPVPTGSFNSTQGSVAVRVVGFDGTTPVSGITVAVSGQPSQTTGASGCVVFDYLPVGPVTVSLNQPGYVGTDGLQSQTRTVTVNAQRQTTVNFSYGRTASALISFYAMVNSVRKTAKSDSVAFESTPGSYAFYGPGGASKQSTIAAPNIIPGTYGVFAGDCSAEDPQLASFGDPEATLTLNSGDTNADIPATGSNPPGPGLQMPAMWIDATELGAHVPVTVTLKRTTVGCPAGKVYTESLTAADNGQLPDPGFPYGSYSVCVRSVSTNKRHTATISLTNLTMGFPTAINIKNNDTTAACP